jgi:hypothetical protein
VSPRAIAQAHASHAWLFDLLFARTSTVTWATAGDLPARYLRKEQFIALPGAGERSFIVSLGSPAAMASALTSYNGLRPGRKRLVRRLIGTGLRSGVAQSVMRTRIDVGAVDRATSEELGDDLLTAHLAQLLDSGPVVVAFSGCTGPYRKPVLQVFSASGSPLGYVKIGWNDWSRKAVRRESAALHARADRQSGLGVPAVLGLSRWHGLDLLITAPLPRGVRRLRASEGQPGVGLLREISGLAPMYDSGLAASRWWLGLRAVIANDVTDPAAAKQLMAFADRIERFHADATLRFGAWHGDLVPWNLARLGQQLYAWDWESGELDAPLGFDALHFHFQVAFVVGQRGVAEAAAIAVSKARPAIEALGVDSAALPLIGILHLLGLLVRHEEARSSTGDLDERFYPAVTRVIEQLLEGSACAVGQPAKGRPS